jgi:lysophospholipase L1-like esterase
MRVFLKAKIMIKKRFLMLFVFGYASVVLLSGQTIAANTGTERAEFKFDFGPGKTAPGYIQIMPNTFYSRELGYGFESGEQIRATDRNTEDDLKRDFCTSSHPFYFSVKLPEGNYKVIITLGDQEGPSTTTVKAELRRLMLKEVKTAAGQFVTRTIMVNTRTPQISPAGQVRLKDREKTSEFRAWDDKLTLEFNDSHPCVCAVEISRDERVPTIYILGDSTVCDQPTEPWNSWGQMLPRFLKPGAAVANHAESGESIRSSLGAGRIDKVMSLIKPGDYLFVQFGHNDMKERSPDALADYKSNLKKLVSDVRAKGAVPVLITSMERKAGVTQDTLGDYPDTVRQAAEEEKTILIDLHAMSKVLYKALGNNIDKAFQDGTHHNNYGSYELAKCVVEGIRQKIPELAKYIVDDFSGFDPENPDPPETFSIPASSS